MKLSELSENQGIAINVTRRYVQLCDGKGELHKGRLASKALETCIGDVVTYEHKDDEVFVTDFEERKNFLTRTFSGKTKKIAANLDHLFIVSAPAPEFHRGFVDRALTAARSELISCSLIVNKTDLGLENIKEQLDVYSALKTPIIYTSAKSEDGITSLREMLENVDLNIICFTGLSGVGKISILSSLLPGVEIEVRELGPKQRGRHTTTRSYAYRYNRAGDPLFLIDLPGIQSFGVEHLTPEDIDRAFDEIADAVGTCKFKGCTHVSEPGCQVIELLDRGVLPQSRYLSMLELRAEASTPEWQLKGGGEAPRPYADFDDKDEGY